MKHTKLPKPVKIQRVKRFRKKPTAKEKALAGLGVVSSLLGGGGGAIKSQNQQQAMVRPKIDETGSASGKIRRALGRIFGVGKAEAQGMIGLTNNSYTDNQNFLVGDSWRIEVNGAVPNKQVWAVGGKNGEQHINPAGSQTDGSGSWALSGAHAADTVGAWQLTFKTGDDAEHLEDTIGSISFAVSNFTVEQISTRAAFQTWQQLSPQEQSAFTRFFSNGQNIDKIAPNFSYTSAFAYALQWGPGSNPTENEIRTVGTRRFKFSNGFWAVFTASPITITTTQTLSPIAVGQDRAFTFAATGGSGQLTWSVIQISPTAKAGLGGNDFRMDTNGVLHVKGTTAGLHSFTVKATDGVSEVQGNFQIVVNAVALPSVNNISFQNSNITLDQAGNGSFITTFSGSNLDSSSIFDIRMVRMQDGAGYDTSNPYLPNGFQIGPNGSHNVSTANIGVWDIIAIKVRGPNDNAAQGWLTVSGKTLSIQAYLQTRSPQQIVNNAASLPYSDLSTFEKDALNAYLTQNPTAIMDKNFPMFRPGSVMAWALGMGEGATVSDLSASARALGFNAFENGWFTRAAVPVGISQARINELMANIHTILYSETTDADKAWLNNSANATLIRANILAKTVFFKRGSIMAWALSMGDGTTLTAEARSLGFINFDSATDSFNKIPPQSLFSINGDLPEGLAGSAYGNKTLTTNLTGSVVWSIASGALPLGMNLNQTSGIVNGTPSQAGSYTFIVKVINGQQQEATKQYTLVIRAAPNNTQPLVITTTSLSTVAPGAYSQQLMATGGSGQRSWLVVPGTGQLPSGVTINPSTGLLSGTVATGVYNFTIEVRDNLNPQLAPARQAYTLTVTPAAQPGAVAPTVGTMTPNSGRQGASVAIRVVGTNLTAATLAFPSGSGISVSGLQSSASELTATFSIADNASVGNKTFTVTTAQGTVSGTFRVDLAPVVNDAAYTFTNITNPGQALKVGDRWRVEVRNASANTLVWSQASKDGSPLGFQSEGRTDGDGKLTFESPALTAAMVGNWNVVIKVGNTFESAVQVQGPLVFRVFAQAAASPTLTFDNFSSQGNPFVVGDRWRIRLSSASVGAKVFAVGGEIVNGQIPAETREIGVVDSQGNFALTSNPLTDVEVGQWNVTIKVGSDQASATQVGMPLIFSVSARTSIQELIAQAKERPLLEFTIQERQDLTAHFLANRHFEDVPSNFKAGSAIAQLFNLTGSEGAERYINNRLFKLTGERWQEQNGAATPAATVTALPNGRVGDDYNVSLEAAGTSNWSVGVGNLPPGILLAEPISGGQASLRGRPTQDGNFVFTLRASNAQGQLVTRQFTLRVSPAGQPIPEPIPPAGSPVVPVRQRTVQTRYTDAELIAGIGTIIYSGDQDIPNAQLNRIQQQILNNLPSEFVPGSVLAFMLGQGTSTTPLGLAASLGYTFNNGKFKKSEAPLPAAELSQAQIRRLLANANTLIFADLSGEEIRWLTAHQDEVLAAVQTIAAKTGLASDFKRRSIMAWRLGMGEGYGLSDGANQLGYTGFVQGKDSFVKGQANIAVRAINELIPIAANGRYEDFNDDEITLLNGYFGGHLERLPESFVPGSYIAYGLSLGDKTPTAANGLLELAGKWGYEFKNGRYEKKSPDGQAPPSPEAAARITQVWAGRNAVDLRVGATVSTQAFVWYVDNTQDKRFTVSSSDSNIAVAEIDTQTKDIKIRAVAAGQAQIIIHPVDMGSSTAKDKRITVRVSASNAAVTGFEVKKNNQPVTNISVVANRSTTLTALARLSDGSYSPSIEVKVENTSDPRGSNFVNAGADENGLITVSAGDPYSGQNPDDPNQQQGYSVILILHPVLAGEDTSFDKQISISIDRQNNQVGSADTETVADMPEYIRRLLADVNAEDISEAQRQEIGDYMKANPKTPPPQTFKPGSWLAYTLGLGGEAPSSENGNDVRALMFGYKYENGSYNLKYQTAWGIVSRTGGAYPEVTLRKGIMYGSMVSMFASMVGQSIVAGKIVMFASMTGPIGAAVGAAVAATIIAVRAIGSDPRKAQDTKIADQFMAQIMDIVDAYNKNRGRTLEDEKWNYEHAKTLITELSSVMTQNFQLSASTSSQLGYVNNFLAAMQQTYTQRSADFVRSLQNLEVKESPDGRRIAYIDTFFGSVMRYPDGGVFSENKKEVPPSIADAIKNSTKATQVPNITEDFRTAGSGIPLPNVPAYIFERASNRQLGELSLQQQEELVQYFVNNPGIFPAEFIPGSFVAEMFNLGSEVPSAENGYPITAVLLGYEYQNGKYVSIFKIPGVNAVDLGSDSPQTLPIYRGARALLAQTLNQSLNSSVANAGKQISVTGRGIKYTIRSMRGADGRWGMGVWREYLESGLDNYSWTATNLTPVQGLVGLDANHDLIVNAEFAKNFNQNFNLMKLKSAFKDLVKPSSANIADWSVIAATTFLGWVHNHRITQQLKLEDTSLANEAFSKIMKVVDIYNRNRSPYLELERDNHQQAVQLVNALFEANAAYFQLKDRSYTSQRQYLDGMIASMNATFAQRNIDFQNWLASLDVYETPDGTRAANLGNRWGMVKVYVDNKIESEKNVPVPDSIINAIKNATNVTKVSSL